ncbi:MAG: MFS transporter [Opitutaceae bacterium]|jgi:ACS family hexuronate transporter-like MFS transporter|nr:MFS transporter [Opitutaceae bacterium]
MKIPNFRWFIIALVFLAAVLNYIDRQALSLLAPDYIKKDLGLDDSGYASIVNIFLVAYTISYLVSGRLIDKLGTRLGMAVFVAFWSVSNMLTAAAHGFRSLGAYRFALGLGEAGVWPAASKSVSEWFPAKERALAIGVYTMGSTIGAIATPFLVLPLAGFDFATHLPFVHNLLGAGAGWRMAFILTGGAGLLWVVPWLLLYRQPRQSPFATEKDLKLLADSEAAEAAAANNNNNNAAPKAGQASCLSNAAPAPAATSPWSWKQIFSSRVVWLLLLGRLITDPAWYFYQFWFPMFLRDSHGVSKSGLTMMWPVFAAAGLGSVIGGLLSGHLIKRGVAPAASRLWTMLGCALLMPVSLLVAGAGSPVAATWLAAASIVAALAWLINISSLVVDLVPKNSLGAVFGVVAAGSTVGGIIMNTLISSMLKPAGAIFDSAKAGFLDNAVNAIIGPLLRQVQGGGYAMWFTLMAFLHLAAWLMLYFGRIHKKAG